MGTAAPILVAIVLIALAWKLFSGIVKTAAFAIILAAAAFFVFGVRA